MTRATTAAGLIFASFFAGAAAYGAGWYFADDATAPQRTGRPSRDDRVALPDPRLLAGSARLEAERIGPAVWSQTGALPAADGQVVMYSGAVPIGAGSAARADLRARPVAAATVARPDEPRPALAQETTPSEIAQALSQSIAAIVRSNGAVRLVVADRATTVRRSLVPGDTFLAGWKLSQIGPGGVTLTKQGRSILVPVAYSANPLRSPTSRPADLAASSTGAAPNPVVQVASRAPAGTVRRRISRRDAAEN